MKNQALFSLNNNETVLQRIHMKNKSLFSLKDKSKKLKSRLLQFLFGALRVKVFGENFSGSKFTLIFASLLTGSYFMKKM